MTTSKRTVLITGCSDGGLGAALAVAFHEKGLKVYATGRSLAKMNQLATLGIDTLVLDVLSQESISDCASKLEFLDILINNAGSQYISTVADINIADAKKLYDVNLWSYIAVTQAFLPLLMKSSEALIVNQTSIAAVLPAPFQAVYNSSKAALASITDALRLELHCFGVKVIELKTALVQSNLIQNTQELTKPSLPKGSIYEPARKFVESALHQNGLDHIGMPADQWAESVVQDLLKKNPPPVIWRGESAWTAWFSTFLPHGTMDGTLRKMFGLEKVEQALRK